MPDTIADNTSTLASLSVGGSVASTVDSGGDVDWFSINLSAGERYTFSLDGVGPTLLGDPFLRLYNAGGTLLASNDDGGPGLNSLISFTASSSGTYYLSAADYNVSGTGDYQLTAAIAPAISTYTLDQVADYLTDGYWGGSGFQFSTSTITYNVQGLTAAEQTLARLALQTWDDVGSFTFVETTASAQITFDHTGSNNASTSSNGSSAQITISSNWNGGDTSIFSYTLQTYIHEIGHALGLGHGGPYNGAATYGVDNIYTNDSWATSIMSYFTQDEAGAGSYALVVGPQLADIIAIGNLYGLSTTTRMGDTVYGFNANAGQLFNFADAIYGGAAPALTIFDSLGTDTLDLSGYTMSQRIDLRAEMRSDVGGGANNIAIARGTVIENAYGGSGWDNVTGNSANNELRGLGGNDTLRGGGGNDIVDGGLGEDTLDFSDSISGIVVSLAEGGSGTADLSAADLGVDTFYGIEGLIGGTFDDALVGNSGNNVLNGGAGNDTLIGGTGADTLIGGTGDDVLWFDSADILLDGGSGFNYLIQLDNVHLNRVIGSLGVSVFIAGSGNDVLNGVGSPTSMLIYGGGGNDILLLGAAGGYIFGQDGADTLTGSSGTDILLGNAGADLLNGGDGNDVLYIDAADGNGFDGGGGTGDYAIVETTDGVNATLNGRGIEVFVGNVGNDTINAVGTVVSMGLYGGGGNDTITTGNGSTLAFGQDGDDVITGGTGGDILVGGAGIDMINGGGGDDFLYIDQSDAIVNGGSGTDTLIVDSLIGANIATGASSIEVLVGNVGNDVFNAAGASHAITFYGNDGNDVFTGGHGADLYFGGNGSDTFRYLGSGTGADTIYDFDANPADGQDLIDVAGRGFNAGSIGTTIILSNSGGNTLVTIGADTILLNGAAFGTVTDADFVFV